MKFFENLKESLYDIIGYILPGLFILHLLYLPFKYSIHATPIYVIINKFNSPQDILDSMIKADSSLCYSIAILFIAYLLGHVSIYLSNAISDYLIVMYFNESIRDKLDEKYDFVNYIRIEVNSQICISHSWLDNIEKQHRTKFIFNYATTTSRFTNHNNLIQKYIAKSNFYSSFCFIFFIVTIDIILNIFYYLFIYILNFESFSLKLDFNLFLLLLSLGISYICFRTFYFEYYRHKKLKEKECYMFLYHEFVEKKKEAVNQPIA